MKLILILVGVSTLSGANANFVKTNSPPISISNGHIPIKHRATPGAMNHIEPTDTRTKRAATQSYSVITRSSPTKYRREALQGFRMRREAQHNAAAGISHRPNLYNSRTYYGGYENSRNGRPQEPRYLDSFEDMNQVENFQISEEEMAFWSVDSTSTS
ncbi:uncharacterized protein LOC111710336 [Eurytemora carolleeae]|uniref:uncharacterized protein LOC111710336 n=1 Tax=Eurytemora carolleeae TaxID=1294199 RepID=UPI000C75961D|nr:uncharacterized protein LOC111710336 [Eurytemora carolleeae]|eukprot:XP_023340167.1 uncharacterized protein LOC111710336 [Eurytemora affinis]